MLKLPRSSQSLIYNFQFKLRAPKIQGPSKNLWQARFVKVEMFYVTFEHIFRFSMTFMFRISVRTQEFLTRFIVLKICNLLHFNF